MKRKLLTGLVLLLLAGCATGPRPEGLISPLKKLTPAVLAEVRYPESGVRTPDDQLIAQAMKDKPELQRAFKDVPLRVWKDGRNVVLLVCSPDGKYCWLEDASWTPNVVDRLCYQCKPLPPAQFTLSPPAGQR